MGARKKSLQPTCSKCNQATIAHNNKQWCPLCGGYVAPADIRMKSQSDIAKARISPPAHTYNREPAAPAPELGRPRGGVRCENCGRAIDAIGIAIVDGGEVTCWSCINAHL
jgi:hypothetical protein